MICMDGQKELVQQHETKTYRELIADDEDSVGLATDTDPVILLHLVHDDLLQASITIFKDLGAHPPEDGIPLESDTAFLLKLILVKEHCI